MKRYSFIQYGITYAYLTINQTSVFIECFNQDSGLYETLMPINDTQQLMIGLGSIEKYESIINRIRYFENHDYPIHDYFEVNDWVYQKIDAQNFGGRKVKWPLDLYYEQEQFKGLVLPHAQFVTFILQVDHHHPVIEQYNQIIPTTPYPLASSTVVDIPTRDHQTLSTWIMLPKSSDPVSTILIRTPYGKMQSATYFKQFVQHGYAVVIQDVRGRSDSSDLYVPKIYDKQDGDDTLNWIASQSWSNQHVGMIGASYLGYVQWAAASTGNPYLKALVSIVTAGSAFIDLPRKGGTYSSGGMALAFGLASKHFDASKLIRDDWDELLKIRPIQNISIKGIGTSIHYIDEELDHPNDDAFWQSMDFTLNPKQVKAPAMIVSGWFDDNQAGTREALSLTQYLDDYRVVLGPWMHKGNANRDINGIEMGSNSLKHDLDLQYLLWFKQHLDHQTYSFNHYPKVQCFLLGSNKWLNSSSWPIATTNKTYYLDNLQLVETQPEASSNSYCYDPNNPTPHIIDVSENELSLPNDYQFIAKRKDVLTYKTSPLKEDLSILGTFKVKLDISSSAFDTDFVVRVVDVTPTGEHLQLADGFLTASYRNSFSLQEWLEKGTITHITIETSMIGKTIPKGHSLGLLITSSADEYIFPHSNTKEGFNTNNFIIATNTIHCKDSCLIVPVLDSK